MTMSKELLLAVLAMDSYNQGYDRGLEHGSTQIGNATLQGPAGGIPIGQEAAWQSIGFYASSYTLNAAVDGIAAGQKIISYRGTDKNFVPPWSDTGSDLWNGYWTAAGLPFSGQAVKAAEFFQAVTGTSTTDPSLGNAIVTGHSLGGGLAGLIGAIYRQQAYLFDNMAFEGAASDLRALAAISNALGIHVFEDFYNNLAPASTLIGSNMHAFATTGEFLTANRILQSTPVTYLDSYAGFRDPFSVLHSMALQSILQFASSPYASVATDWQAVGQGLWSAGFKDAVSTAAQAGLPALSGSSSASGKLLTAIAYSAIDEGVRVFGDTGIRAMFNDANDLGGIVKLADGSTTIIQAAGALSDILMQYAGQLAFGKVLQSASPAALNGILAVDPGKTVLTVDLSAQQWELGRVNYGDSAFN